MVDDDYSDKKNMDKAERKNNGTERGHRAEIKGQMAEQRGVQEIGGN